MSSWFLQTLQKYLAGSCLSAWWKSSSVVPAVKNSGERPDSSNSRPIYLFPLFSKSSRSINAVLVNYLTLHVMQTIWLPFRQTFGILAFPTSSRVMVSREEYLAIYSIVANKSWNAGRVERVCVKIIYIIMRESPMEQSLVQRYYWS